ncbi:NTP transferase domain-containing protein [Phaeobacter sp. 11ANDIMAR09]|uniref:nucleotidyltransferase family protein n=1 Tax=Phaeobacter sp. 11ANDIMAR09 TaxID=1225647 RepID=UPI0006C87F42|nr:nucleotidyltransferase family protein [Phaeobacter sp. 11ANDIMAR09]KPD12374.1 4-diphosphocytidyl-2C-methyl-D-erythritol synthase [Phaeobacter sp. 11ANDIMAR09]
MSNMAILLLAAGASSRMKGRDKLMEPVQGMPLLNLICRRASQTGLPCYVTVPTLDHPRVSATGTARVVAVPDASEGMSASIRAGVRALEENIEAVMILPCDMPELQTEDFSTLANRFRGAASPVLRATSSDGTPGHPVLFPRRCFAELSQITGDQGARILLRDQEVELIALPGQRALTDLDTPEAWARWRANQ